MSDWANIYRHGQETGNTRETGNTTFFSVTNHHVLPCVLFGKRVKFQIFNRVTEGTSMSDVLLR